MICFETVSEVILFIYKTFFAISEYGFFSEAKFGVASQRVIVVYQLSPSNEEISPFYVIFPRLHVSTHDLKRHIISSAPCQNSSYQIFCNTLFLQEPAKFSWGSIFFIFWKLSDWKCFYLVLIFNETSLSENCKNCP